MGERSWLEPVRIMEPPQPQRTCRQRVCEEDTVPNLRMLKARRNIDSHVLVRHLKRFLGVLSRP